MLLTLLWLRNYSGILLSTVVYVSHSLFIAIIPCPALWFEAVASFRVVPRSKSFIGGRAENVTWLFGPPCDVPLLLLTRIQMTNLTIITVVRLIALLKYVLYPKCVWLTFVIRTFVLNLWLEYSIFSLIFHWYFHERYPHPWHRKSNSVLVDTSRYKLSTNRNSFDFNRRSENKIASICRTTCTVCNFFVSKNSLRISTEDANLYSRFGYTVYIG